MVRNAKWESKKKNIPFDITPKDLEVPLICPVLGIPIKVSEGLYNDNSPSLDKIKPSLGYVKNNVRVISFRANRLKCDMTKEEAKKIFEDACRYDY